MTEGMRQPRAVVGTSAMRARAWSPWVALAVLPCLGLPARARDVVLPPDDAPPTLAPSAPSGARPCDGVVLGGRCYPSRCPVGELEAGGFCLSTAGAVRDDDLAVVVNAHTDRSGRHVVYEQIPRAAGLPDEYDRYVYPVPTEGAHPVTSGYDLDRPDAQQRRGAGLSAVGHGGVDLPQPRSTPARVLALRAQEGDAEVVHVGWLFGNTVVLRQVVRDGDTLWTYLTLYGHLEAPAAGLARGMFLRAGAVVGYVGDTGAEGFVHLHYEVRRVRAGVDVMREDLARVTEQEVSIPCDPRNVLPWR